MFLQTTLYSAGEKHKICWGLLQNKGGVNQYSNVCPIEPDLYWMRPIPIGVKNVVKLWLLNTVFVSLICII